MKYSNITEAKFIDRPNRFIAHVEFDGKTETVHVKNTGRCKELLLPNTAVGLVKSDNPDRKTKYVFGDSRIDFYMEKDQTQYLMEVKGCTLEIDGVGYFPDAPTERGVKHLRELTKAVRQGYRCYIAFVIQMEGIDEVRPNEQTHKEFAEALREAETAGVEVLHLTCGVGIDELRILDDDTL